MISQGVSKHITEYIALRLIALAHTSSMIYHQNVVIFSATIIYFFENVANHK